MLVVIGIWLALAGGVAALAGAAGLRRARRLRRIGVPAWAMAVPSPTVAGDEKRGSRRRTLIQYALADGRVIEQVSPPRPTRTVPLEPGQRLLVWYDPDDPREVLAFGHDRQTADWAYLAGGVLCIAAGASIATLIG